MRFNAFALLTAGSNYSRIKEESFSSFLAYLLTPQEDHGLSDIFLIKFLEKLDLVDMYKNLSIIEIKAEYPVAQCRIDLHINFTNHDESDEFNIVIENKVKDTTSLSNNLELYIGDKNNRDRTFLVLLTPPNWNKKGIEVFDQLDHDKKIHMKWGSEDSNSSTISNIISDILKEESTGDVTPLSSEIKHYLKSLKDFIRNDMSKNSSRRNYIDIGMIVKDIKIEVEERLYHLRQYESKTIKVYDIDLEEEVAAKPVLRSYIRSNVPSSRHDKMLDDPSIRKRLNTRTMGKRLIEWIETNNKKEKI